MVLVPLQAFARLEHGYTIVKLTLARPAPWQRAALPTEPRPRTTAPLEQRRGGPSRFYSIKQNTQERRKDMAQRRSAR
jgi:hypothetical protein